MTDPASPSAAPSLDAGPALAAALDAAGRAAAGRRMELDPDTLERDLARLVLALMEFLRQLMELQAIRRLERGTLSESEEERLGSALMRASIRVREIAAQFGLTERDLELDLGPLGRLV